ncbi:MAG: shikimate dehydrogenase [Clostridiales bacterium]|jgi:shikimate dehydrogenase|nr:shikimate dehydrogenase [Clostridiales bacterium]
MTPILISGKTAVYGVIGDPVAHSLSPRIHKLFAQKNQDDLIYAAFHVQPSHLGPAVHGAHSLGLPGLNVTIPHKQTCMDFCSAIDPDAEQMGAVNTLVYTKDGYQGFNTDWIGMDRALQARGVCIAGRSVVVLGAGGSARAACVMAGREGAAHLTIVNRTREKAEALARLTQKIPISVMTPSEIGHIKKKDIVIQTTSVGFGSQAGLSPVGSESFFEGVDAAFDIIYIPWETEFLKMARRASVKTAFNGFSMLVYQAAAAYEIWRGAALKENFLSEVIETLSSEIKQDFHS